MGSDVDKREVEVVRRRRVAESISCSGSKEWVEGPVVNGSSRQGKRKVRCVCFNNNSRKLGEN